MSRIALNDDPGTDACEWWAEAQDDRQARSQPGHACEAIIGASAALTAVLRQVELVAPTDATVLLQGETGTGKELIAHALHQRSARRHHPFIKVNGAAIPSGLLESELFGHERGAFTGAIGRHLGRFELAHQATLFLDEVGDLPLDLQPKLLRVLQEQAFERVGGTRTIGVDVRLVVATHRDLAPMVLAARSAAISIIGYKCFPFVSRPYANGPRIFPSWDDTSPSSTLSASTRRSLPCRRRRWRR